MSAIDVLLALGGEEVAQLARAFLGPFDRRPVTAARQHDDANVLRGAKPRGERPHRLRRRDAVRVDATGSPKRAIVRGPSTAGDGALPGLSRRMPRCRASAGMSGWKVLLLPPRPCTQTTASPSPSSSTTMRSKTCSVIALAREA